MSGYLQAVRAFSPSLWRIFASITLVISVTMGLQAVLLNLYLLRLGYDAHYVGLLAGIGQVVWALSAFPAVLVSNRIGLRNQLSVEPGAWRLWPGADSLRRVTPARVVGRLPRRRARW